MASNDTSTSIPDDFDPEETTVLITGGAGVTHRIAWEQGILTLFKAVL